MADIVKHLSDVELNDLKNSYETLTIDGFSDCFNMMDVTLPDGRKGCISLFDLPPMYNRLQIVDDKTQKWITMDKREDILANFNVLKERQFILK